MNTSYDGAGRVNGVTGTGSKNYATSILYAPQGGMTSLALGNLLTESTAYNNRLQPTSISVGTRVSLGYAYGTSNNNGNVQSQTITAPGLSLTQTYGYDWLNRLTGMNETSGWSETFSYDPYGNRTGGSSSSPYMPLQIPTINAQTNKITAANHSYDAVGNLIQGLGADQLVKTYTYDADNRLVTFNGSAATYSYDGDGRRVKKVVGSATTVLVYDAHGQMVAEYSNQAPPTSGGTSYVTADHLGSTRLVTDSTGTVIARHDYAPFGEEITSVIGGRSGVAGYGVDEGLRQKFTGKERDSESNLDNFGARYDASSLGRFMTPDPLGGKLVDPQTLNRYSYVINNPLRCTDPTGLYTCKDDNNQCKTKQDTQFEKARQADLARGGDAARAAAAYGDPTKDNHVAVGFADLDKKGEGGVTRSTLGADEKANLFAQSDVTINSKLSGTAFEAAVGHEGSHVADAQDVVSSISQTTTEPYFKVGADITRYQSEQRAYAVTDSILKSSNENWHFACGLSDCVLGTGMQMLGQRPGVIDQIMANSPLYRSNGQPLSPSNQGGSVVLTVPH